MMFEWDEAKRGATIEKHGIDFLDAIEVFSTDHIVLEARSEVEQRKRAIGSVEGVLLAVVYTERNDTVRIITARRARRNEREEFHARISRGGAKAPQ